MPVPDSIDLISAQERAVEAFFDASDESTLELAAGVAQTLRQVAEDGQLWDELREGSRSNLAAREVRQLVLVDWESLLEQWGVSDAEGIALELINGVGRGASEPGAWDDVREGLFLLADRIDGDVRDPQPAENRGWWQGVRERANRGVSVLRRVKVGAVVVRAATFVTDQAVPIVVGGVFLAGAGPLAPIALGAAVYGVGRSAFAGVRDALAEDRAERIEAALSHLFEDPALQPGGVGVRRSTLMTIEEMLSAGSGRIPLKRVTELVASLRTWAAHVGARLASLMPQLVAGLGPSGLYSLEAAMSCVFEFQRALRKIGSATDAGATDMVRRAVGASLEALDRIADALQQLNWRLADAGFGGHG